MLEMTKRGISLLGEAYQTSFDELREEISKKDGLSFKDSIHLADFIQQNGLNKKTALANINEHTAVPLCNRLKKAEALSDACLHCGDVVILNEIINNPIFDDNNLKTIIKYASGSSSLDRGVMSVRSACAYFEEELHKEVTDCLTRERRGGD